MNSQTSRSKVPQEKRKNSIQNRSNANLGQRQKSRTHQDQNDLVSKKVVKKKKRFDRNFKEAF